VRGSIAPLNEDALAFDSHQSSRLPLHYVRPTDATEAPTCMLRVPLRAYLSMTHIGRRLVQDALIDFQLLLQQTPTGMVLGHPNFAALSKSFYLFRVVI